MSYGLCLVKNGLSIDSFIFNLFFYKFEFKIFLIFTIIHKTRGDKLLRLLLQIHGVFFITCLLLPMLSLFTPDLQGGNVIGTIVLLVWCAYFLPICALSWRYFD
jgi:hypothetical protein